ncbi:MAG: 2TM domain-containing protein, partial [Halobacteriales archaeon]|nr:2TM domain-containing protein [Halobacteriales archaeon]
MSERSAAQRHTDRIIFGEHVAAFVALNGVLAWMKYSTWPAAPWDWWVPLGWGVGLAIHGWWAWG